MNDWTVSSNCSLRGNLVVNSVTGFGNFDNADVAFDSAKFDCGDANRTVSSREKLHGR